MTDVIDATEYKNSVIELKAATDTVKKFAETATAEIKNLGAMTHDTKAAADKALATMNALDARVAEMEQKAARRGHAEPVEFKSFGQRVIEGEEFKAALAQGTAFKGRAQVELKAVAALTTPATSGGQSIGTSLVPAQRVGPVMLQQYPLAVRNLIAPGTTDSNAIEYPVETVNQLNAAPVAEGAMKPQSDLTFSMQNAPVRTLAHFMMASRQILADSAMLMSVIDQRLRYGLDYVEDQQFLLGDGTGQNIKGLMPQASSYAAPGGVTVTNETRIDRLRLAQLQATLALLPSSGIVLHPVDWFSITLAKDTQGRYIIGNPQDPLAPNLWGLPVVTSFAMPTNNFLLGAFRTAAQIFDREVTNVMVSTEDRSNFVTNMVTILCESRTCLAVFRPQAFVKGVFTGTQGAPTS